MTVVRTEVFMASDGEAGIRAVEVTQKDYDELCERLRAAETLLGAMQELGEAQVRFEGRKGGYSAARERYKVASDIWLQAVVKTLASGSCGLPVPGVSWATGYKPPC